MRNSGRFWVLLCGLGFFLSSTGCYLGSFPNPFGQKGRSTVDVKAPPPDAKPPIPCKPMPVNDDGTANSGDPDMGGCGEGGHWGTMTKEQKAAQMQKEVYPMMLKLFSNYDDKYAKPGAFHCMTCHGKPEDKNATASDFSKPSVLYPLDPNNLPTGSDPDPKVARAAKFMRMVVLPTMQKFLGPQLTCFSCHARKGETTNTTTPDDKPEDDPPPPPTDPAPAPAPAP